MTPTANILIVDDSEAIRLVLSDMLTEYTSGAIKPFSNALAALTHTQESQPDLIFVDLNMPDMDGMELIRELGSMGFQGGVIIASGVDERIIKLASDIAKQNLVHLIASLIKPITREHLKACMDKFACFQQHRHVAENPLKQQEIDQAINEMKLLPYYQPKINTASNKILGFELLARIDSPTLGGIIPPSRFIRVAEDNNLIDKLTYTLLNQALKDFTELRSLSLSHVSLAFNLSPVQLENLDTPRILDELVNHHKIKPKDLVIEVTEEYALRSANQLETLNRLRLKGYGVALDDFGTGFTNINQLLNLPFSEIKIDQNLISNIHHDHFSQVITKTICEICKNLDIDLVAEGIEQIEELECLHSISKQIFTQGYLISKPKPLSEIKRWIKSLNNSNTLSH